MELKVWVEGIQRIVCGVVESTTCQDVVYALAHATAQTGRFTLIERWRSNERLLAPHESPATVLMKWGEYAPEVQFILRRSMSPCNKTLASLDAYGTHGMRFNSVSDHSAQTIKIGQVHDDATTTIPILNSDTEQGALARDCDIRKSVTFNEPYGYDTNSNVEAQSENVVVIQPAPQSKARASCVRKSTHKNIQSTAGPLSSGGSILYFPHKKVRELPPYREPPGLLSPVRTLPPYREPPPPNSNSPNRLQFQGDSNSAGVTHHKENLSSPRNSTRSKRILVQEFHEIKGMSQFSCSVGGQPACMMSVAYTQRYVELIRLVNRQRDTINAQQADLTKCDAEILYWESKNREQTHHMDFISQEVNRIESTGRIIEEQLKDLAHIEEESEIVRQQEKTLKSEITLLRSKLANCETELLQCKNKMRLVMEELALEQHSMGRQSDERKIAECKMIGELERLQEEVEHAQQSTDSTCQCAEALKFDISNLETVIIEKKMQVERLVTDMKEANLQSLTVASQDDQVKHMMEGVSFTEGFYLCAMGPFVAQGFAALVGSLAILDAGMIYGWPTSSLPKLLHQQSEWDDESEMKITSEEGSWVVSISVFASILGPALLKLAVDRIGRRWSLNGIVLIMLISWLAIGLARGVEVLYVGRFIGGLAVGAAFPVTSMYLGEIADDQIRGILGSVLSVSLVLGQLLTVCAGPWISRPMLSIFSSTPLIIFLIAFPWMPETAYFWLIKGDRERASASLVWLRQRADVMEELRTLQILVNEEQKNRDGSDTARLFRIRSNRRAFFIAIGLITFQQLSGAQAITAYAGIIFEESGLTGWTNWSMIIMGAFALLAALSTLFAIDAAGRRPILMLSAVFTVFFLLCEAIFFHFKYLGYDTSSFAWIPLFGLVGFHLSVYPGLGGIPWLMVGELFPTDVKAIAAILLGTHGSLTGFLVAKLYEPMGSAFGIHSVYYVFAIFTCSGLFFIYFIVPETKKRSFEDIQNLLNTGSSEKLEKTAKI